MSVAYGKGPKGKATRLHAELVRARGHCERCGATSGLQCAHIISRMYSHTRTDERNAWCLCASCHSKVDLNVGEKMALVDATIGRDVFDELYQKSRSLERFKNPEWEAEVVRLQGLR